MKQVKGNQGGRTREITKPFADLFRSYHAILKADEVCNVAHGRFSYASSDGVKVIYHDGDLIAKWDLNRGTQWGSLHNLRAAYDDINKSDIDSDLSRLGPMLRDVSTRLNTILMRARRVHENAGLSISTHEIMILKDVAKPESSDNILFRSPLAGTVRAVF